MSTWASWLSSLTLDTANEHWLWVMRPNVAQALEDLGGVPRVSHLLYPDLALEAGT